MIETTQTATTRQKNFSRATASQTQRNRLAVVTVPTVESKPKSKRVQRVEELFKIFNTETFLCSIEEKEFIDNWLIYIEDSLNNLLNKPKNKILENIIACKETFLHIYFSYRKQGYCIKKDKNGEYEIHGINASFLYFQKNCSYYSASTRILLYQIDIINQPNDFTTFGDAKKYKTDGRNYGTILNKNITNAVLNFRGKSICWDYVNNCAVDLIKNRPNKKQIKSTKVTSYNAVELDKVIERDFVISNNEEIDIKTRLEAQERLKNNLYNIELLRSISTQDPKNPNIRFYNAEYTEPIAEGRQYEIIGVTRLCKEYKAACMTVPECFNIDMKSCHPSILLDFLKNKKRNTPAELHVIQFLDSIQDLKTEFLTIQDKKFILNSTINGASTAKNCSIYRYLKSTVSCLEILDNKYREFKKIYRQFHLSIKQIAHKIPNKAPGKTNDQNRMAYWLQHKEQQILKQFHTYTQTNEHDGGQIIGCSNAMYAMDEFHKQYPQFKLVIKHVEGIKVNANFDINIYCFIGNKDKIKYLLDHSTE